MRKDELSQIVFQFFYNTLPTKYHSFVKRWLLETKNVEEKTEALHFIWNHINVKSDKNTSHALHRVHHRLGLSSSHPIRTHLKYAAIALLLFSSAIGVWIFMNRIKNQQEEMVICRVPNGQLKTIYLPDSSVIKLNSGSAIKYPKHFDKDFREVYLRGEAVFLIKHNPGAPFLVHVGNLVVKDIGTRFNIKAYHPNFIVTTLVDGRVCEYESQSKSKEVMNLVPGEQCIYCANKHEFSKEKVDADKYISWTKGNLIFIQSPLSHVISDIEHHFNVKVNVKKGIPLNLLFTTQFSSSESLQDVLNVLTKMGDFKYEMKGDTICLSEK